MGHSAPRDGQERQADCEHHHQRPEPRQPLLALDARQPALSLPGAGHRLCEWEGEKGSKLERWFNLPSSPIFAFAGIWRPSEEGNCYAFLTCEPNPVVAPIHAKAMPVILHPEDYDHWLDGEVESACSLAQPFPSQLMRVA